MQNNLNTKVLDTIKKLLALQSSTTSEAEAQNCAARIQEILLKHNLDMSMVDNHELSQKNPVIRVDIDLNPYSGKSDSDWVIRLLNSLAITNFCRLIQIHNGSLKGIGALIGRTENVQSVQFLFEYLIPTIKRLSSEAWSQYEGPEKKNAFKRAFYRACVRAIYHRLSEQFQKMEKEQQPEPNKADGTPTTNPVTALVIQNNEALDKFVNNEFSNLRKGTHNSRGLSGRGGAERGYEAGRNVSLNSQLSQGKHQISN